MAVYRPLELVDGNMFDWLSVRLTLLGCQANLRLVDIFLRTDFPAFFTTKGSSQTVEDVLKFHGDDENR